MQLQVPIPHWAEDETDERWIVLLGLMNRLSQAYGSKHTFEIYNEDLRIIMGELWVMPGTIFEERNWGDNFTCVQLKENKCGLRIKMTKNRKLANSMTVNATITDERLCMIWLYLLGTFNNNLVERPDPDGRKRGRMGVTRDYKKIFWGYAELLQDE